MKKYTLPIVALSLFFALSCGYALDSQMAASRQALHDAAFAKADKNCPELYREAEKHMQLAEEALKAGDKEKARVEAQYAQITAGKSVTCRKKDIEKLP